MFSTNLTLVECEFHHFIAPVKTKKKNRQLLIHDMVNSFVIIFHFFNLAFGLTALLYFSKRMSERQSSFGKLFLQQALFYNLAVLLTAMLDFLYFYFWRDVSGNALAANFLTVINLSNLVAAVLWCYSFVLMIYNSLDTAVELKGKRWFNIGLGIAILFLGLFYLSSAFNIFPIVHGLVSIIFGYSIFTISLGYSIYLYRKSAAAPANNKYKALKVFGLLFIVYSAISLLAYVNAYPLRMTPRIVTQFGLNFLDFLFNAITLFWVINYYKHLENGKPAVEANKFSEDELAVKYQISKRELEVIHLVCSGKSNQEIADELFISLGTVKDHLYKIYKKIGIKNRTQLAKLF
ncbi:MAG: LuxR C-terminal-related transcriptional regulator [bacterium]